jgi:hypothetical protein
MSDPLFVTWQDEKEDGGESKKRAFASASKGLDRSTNFVAKGSDIFRNIEGNLSIRDGMSRRDYNTFRPNEARPEDHREIIKSCRIAYRTIGIVNNIVNLMRDFTIQGIGLVHPNKKIENFYQEWWEKINGREVSSKFVKNLLRDGISSVQRTTAKLRAVDVDNLERGYAADIERVERPVFLEKNEIPWKYTFLNPLLLNPLGDDLALFAGKSLYSLTIPANLIDRIRNPKTLVDISIVDELPENVVDYINKGNKQLPLDGNKVQFFHYNKDDWEKWSDPLLYPILDDIIMLNKMKLADLAALDGAVSHIRLWRLGSLADRILPTQAGINKLSEILINNVGGGAMDLIWGPELDIKETSTEVYKFLGSEKYGATLASIYNGLGIPSVLMGGSAATSGSTTSYISLKTLLERLKYIRNILIEFWTKEIKLVQKSMSFRQPADLQFDKNTLSDEASEKALMLQMVDRNLISIESLQERFGELPELEAVRLKKENRRRKKKFAAPKYGPYADQTETLQKIALQQGSVTPSEVGLELDENDGEKTLLEIQADIAEKQNKQDGPLPAYKPKGRPGQGRPQGSKDKSRKQRTVLPKSSAELVAGFAWAKQAQEFVADIIDPLWLKIVNKSNARMLTDGECKQVEDLKFAVLCELEVYEKLEEEKIISILDNEKLCIPAANNKLMQNTLTKYMEKFGREPSLKEIRQMQASIYVFSKGDFQ